MDEKPQIVASDLGILYLHTIKKGESLYTFTLTFRSAKKQSFTPTEPMRLFSEPSLSDRLMSSWQSKNVNFSNGCNQQENGSSPALGAYDNADVVLEEATPNTNNTDGTKTDLEKEVDKKKLPHHLKPLQKKEEHDRNQTETKI